MASVVSARLLPAFGPLPLDRIDRAGVTRWFDEYSRTAPGGANNSLKLLRQILNHAVDCGHLDTNPARGVKRNPRPMLTRFLSRDEVRRLHGELDRCTRERPSHTRQADIIRLLLLTGCRRGEILTLRWQDVDGDTLNLVDAKTGPRRVYLNEPARAILERQPRTGSVYVFPSPLDPKRPLSSGLPLWYRVRKQAGIETCACMTSGIPSPATPSARRAVAGGLVPSRPQESKYDASLRPCRRPGDRGSCGAYRRCHLAGHG